MMREDLFLAIFCHAMHNLVSKKGEKIFQQQTLSEKTPLASEEAEEELCRLISRMLIIIFHFLACLYDMRLSYSIKEKREEW